LTTRQDGEISALADVMNPIDYQDGEYIVEVGGTADTLFLLLSGEVVCHRDGGGKELLRLQQGAFFGESALSEKEEERQRLANVVAVGKVRVGALKADDFKQVVGSLTESMNRALNRKAIDSVEMLKGSLTPVEMDELQRALQDVTYEAGTTVITQGEVGTKFCIIRSGGVNVFVDDVKVNSLGLGAVFGERALLTAEPTVASVITNAPTTLMTLDKNAFERVLPPLQDLIARGIAEREEQAARAARPKILFKDLKTIAVLGEGTFGRVRLVQWKHRGSKQPFALKCLQKGQLVYYKQVDHVVNEKRVLEACFHPFILKLEGTFMAKHQVFMLLEVALGGELFTHLRSEGKFSQETSALYAAMVCSSFSYLHARKIAHRDLKPENLLFDEKGYLKLVDFGFAKVIKDRTWTLCGTPEYLAPEIISNRGHGCGVDWWTLGILTYEMLVGQPPFVGATQLDTYHKVTRGKYKMPMNLHPKVKDFISRLLMHNPAGRLGCGWGGPSEAAFHDFFTGINFKELEARQIPMPHVPEIKNAFDTSNFDSYSDDDGAAQWVQFNSSQFEPVWKSEFDNDGK
jgi:CRP-like cAMP-binding protein